MASQLILCDLKRFGNLANSFTNLESKAETLHAAQKSQAAMQNLLHEQVHQMRTEVQMVRQVMMEIASSASAAEVVLEKNASQLAKFATLAGVISTIEQLCWATLGIILLSRFSSKLAGYAAAALGIACFSHFLFI